MIKVIGLDNNQINQVDIEIKEDKINCRNIIPRESNMVHLNKNADNIKNLKSNIADLMNEFKSMKSKK